MLVRAPSGLERVFTDRPCSRWKGVFQKARGVRRACCQQTGRRFFARSSCRLMDKKKLGRCHSPKTKGLHVMCKPLNLVAREVVVHPRTLLRTPAGKVGPILEVRGVESRRDHLWRVVCTSVAARGRPWFCSRTRGSTRSAILRTKTACLRHCRRQDLTELAQV